MSTGFAAELLLAGEQLCLNHSGRAPLFGIARPIVVQLDLGEMAITNDSLLDLSALMVFWIWSGSKYLPERVGVNQRIFLL